MIKALRCDDRPFGNIDCGRWKVIPPECEAD